MHREDTIADTVIMAADMDTTAGSATDASRQEENTAVDGMMIAIVQEEG